MIMKHSTRRTGAHRADRIMDHYAPADRTPISHRRGTRRSERRYTHALAETPVAPWWAAERLSVPAEDAPDTVTLPRVVERVITSVRERRESRLQRFAQHPDRWLWGHLSAAVACGVVIGVLGVMPLSVPDMPYGQYSVTMDNEGVSDSELIYWSD